MESINIICSIIVFLYLCIIFLLIYYKNGNLKRNKKYLMKIEKINPTMNIYCCDLISTSKLFWITLIELIEKKYYKLYEKDDILYIKKTNKNTDDLNLFEYQKNVLDYANRVIEEDSIKLEDLYYNMQKDCNSSNIINNYITSLRKNTKDVIGDMDRLNSYKFSIISTFIYSIQVFYFLTDDINILGRILIALPFTYFTIVISDLLKNRIGKLKKEKYIIIFAISLIISLITSSIWNGDTSNNYLIFHFLMGIFTYMYPLLIVINVYSIRTNNAYNNKIQQDLINQMNNIEEKNINKINYLYLKLLKLKRNNDELIDKYFDVLDL